jgi:hypothetical protein
MFAAAQKLSIIEERLQEQSCLFEIEDYRNKGHSPEKLTWILCFGEYITESLATKPKLPEVRVLESVLDLGIFFYYIVK